MREFKDGKERYNCKDNDNVIMYDKEETEIYIGDILEEAWTVIGIDDLKEAIKKFKITL